ncbi:THAP domain-containing protein 3 isoform X1 [Phascolarctos cinereus]|uniref:THAP domain-containing protein 3 isoform X1 n=1 Tax=Phascolarctos cinereus TaxID=38626 RepID=A0A6P5JHK5_PHACI|nr:THAP domain-containing protein 3 isoform X1 [Phascolarctos cinereus]
MPKSCAARQCCNRYSSRRKQLTFHRFPFSRPELLKEWVLNIGRGNFKPKQHTVICSEHFQPDCFSAFGNRKNLKQNAVPTVFAFRETAQLVRENTDPAGQRSDAQAQPGKVFSGAGAGEYTPGRKMEIPLDKHQLSPDAEASEKEVSSYTTQEVSSRLLPTSPPGQRGSLPFLASDHSYALLDLDALKKKLVLTLKENERLRRRLKMQRVAMRRMSSRLQALQEEKRRKKALQREEEGPAA